MDDEQFKLEVLNRLDKIVSLLSISCNISKAALERSQPVLPKPQTPAAEQERTTPSRPYLILDEMQENYDMAVQKWKTGRGGIDRGSNLPG